MLEGSDRVTFGTQVLRIRGEQPVVLDRVELHQPQHLKLLGAHLLPIEKGDTLIGSAADYPPERPGCRQILAIAPRRRRCGATRRALAVGRTCAGRK